MTASSTRATCASSGVSGAMTASGMRSISSAPMFSTVDWMTGVTGRGSFGSRTGTSCQWSPRYMRSQLVRRCHSPVYALRNSLNSS